MPGREHLRAHERTGGVYSFSSGGTVYRFSRCIGRGGMGEVYLGMQEGMGGLERLVVIKRIYPQFGDDEHFTGMLLEEARLAASIRHPNVVQILDIGKDASGYFIVMEYLSGETLVYITRSLRARDLGVPPAIACRIAAEVAAGLHCAHTATDPAGNPQPIVHRDVTPSNLIVCFNGVVKIVDFGVAKATLHEGNTRGGVKGKMSYLAPEQLYDRPIDGRTDVFQLGICLHELLTGERLFQGDNDHQRAVAVMQQPILPPSKVVRSLPKMLDDVVLWALERDPARRPSTADEFRRALEAATTGLGSLSGHDLGGWMKVEFENRLAERASFERQCVAEMREGRSSLPVVPVAAVVAAPARVAADGGAKDRLATVEPLPARMQSVGSLSPTPPSSAGESRLPYKVPLPKSEGRSPPPTVSRQWTLLGLIGVAAVLGTLAGIMWILGTASSGAATERKADRSRRPSAALPAEAAGALATPSRTPAPAPAPAGSPPQPAEPREFEVGVTAAPAEAVIEIDRADVGKGSYRARLPRDGTRHIMTVRADGYETVALDFTDVSPPSRVVLERARPPAPAELPSATRSAKRVAPAGKRERTARPRPTSDDGERVITDNPDPWAEEPDAPAGEKPPQGSR